MAEAPNAVPGTRKPSGSFPLQRRDRGVAQSLGAALLKKVKDSRVLLVGAGGIGCEVLKNLVCCGFGSSTQHPAVANSGSDATIQLGTQSKFSPGIVVVDLDTIDLSNLNRQFLFRKQHIKKPKAMVAKDTASQFNPAVRIDAHHASIFDAQFDVDFFAGFDIVFNALDNLSARRLVNKMCLAADIPLIESGTTGFNGQVQAIRKGLTECYDCNPKPVQKSFPICTIRSTPSQPIHCIVWAKSYLFPELFGTSEEESSEMTVTENDDAEEVAKLKEETEALKKIRKLMGDDEFAQEVFNKVFHDDIERLRSMTEMWQSRKRPESLKFDALTEQSAVIKQGQALSSQEQRPWSLLENISVFCYSLDVLRRRTQAGEKVIEFDKDDKDTLDFVASAANLRSHIFDIPLHSEWEIKKMAGNIIPAIATSNALTASLCVLEAFKILRSANPTATLPQPALGGAKEIFLTSRNTERMIASQALAQPNPSCPVCSATYARLVLPNDASATLGALVDLLKQSVGYGDFSITLDTLGMIYDPEFDDNLSKSLSELGIDGSKKNEFITVTDDSDEPKVDLLLSLKTRPIDEDTASLTLEPSELKLPLKPKAQQDGPAEPNGTAERNGGDDMLETSVSAGAKRKRDPEDEIGGGEQKKQQMEKEGAGVTVVDDDGAILLDDD